VLEIWFVKLIIGSIASRANQFSMKLNYYLPTNNMPSGQVR